jgi:hypothetical protein
MHLQRADGGETIRKSFVSLALWQHHEEAVETLQEIAMVTGVHIQEMQANRNEDRRLQELHKFVDLHQEVDSDFHRSKGGHEMSGEVVSLGVETEREGCHGGVGPTVEESHEQVVGGGKVLCHRREKKGREK